MKKKGAVQYLLFLALIVIGLLLLLKNCDFSNLGDIGGNTNNGGDDSVPPVDDTPVPPSWSNGDIVASESGNENMGAGVNEIINPIELNFEPGGNCHLKARINTGWDYLTPETCMGIQANEGMKFTFADSTGVVWQRIDTNPTGLGFETPCNLVWDGVHQWAFTAKKILGLYQCQISLDYDIDIVACNCE